MWEFYLLFRIDLRGAKMLNQSEFNQVSLSSLPVEVRHSCFLGESGVSEWYVVMSPVDYESIETQLSWLKDAYLRTLDELGLKEDCAVWRRFHCSDLQNQAEHLRGDAFSDGERSGACAVSWVGQAPAGDARVSLCAYFVSEQNGSVDLCRAENTVELDRGELKHFWRMGLSCAQVSESDEQSLSIFGEYCGELRKLGMTLRDHVVRTWLWVKDVDNNYQGLVDARNAVFAEEGLGQDSHTIASTGIEGEGCRADQLVTMDAYAIAGLRREQVEYLSALDYLSPTQLYGVAFERATSVAYRDRRHVFISGTASIDWQGKIVHVGNVELQLERTLRNIEGLLEEAGLGLKAMTVFTVYVRDLTDLAFVESRMKRDFPSVPMVVVKAPVCRPGWLVEIEGVAIGENRDRALPLF